MEKPSCPMWDHGVGMWYYRGRFYDDPHQAEHLYTNDLLLYIDVLNIKIEKLTSERNRFKKMLVDNCVIMSEEQEKACKKMWDEQQAKYGAWVPGRED